MGKFVYVGKISKTVTKAGGANMVIWIPKDFHKEVEEKLDISRQLKITIEDDFLGNGSKK